VVESQKREEKLHVGCISRRIAENLPDSQAEDLRKPDCKLFVKVVGEPYALIAHASLCLVLV